ncbi:MAG: lipid II flippase MurJ, partial [Pseudomonadota bacterium]
MNLFRSFVTVGFWTFLSRILGLARDLAIAATLGAGPVAEAFWVAFSLPNMFRRFFAEGALNTAFLPLFSKKLESGEGAEVFARDVFSLLAGLLIVFTVAAMLAMPALVLAMAYGFQSDARFEIATLMGRITFPYILFISLAALLSGILNAHRRFVAAAAAPILLNGFFLSGLALATHAGWDFGLTLAWTVPVAGVAQLAFVWVAA